MKKYELTEESREVFGRKLYRIRALRSFSNVAAGALGGFVESESNLLQEGPAWIYDNACVYDDARVHGDAQVCGGTNISQRTHILTIGPIGRSNDTITFQKGRQGMLVSYDDYCGGVDAFLEKVREAHEADQTVKIIELAIQLAKMQILEGDD